MGRGIPWAAWLCPAFTELSVFQCSLPRCGELHADRQPGAEEAGLPVPDELCQKPARHGHHGCQQLCEGNLLLWHVRKGSSTVAASTSVSISLWELCLCFGAGLLQDGAESTKSGSFLSLLPTVCCRGDDFSSPLSGCRGSCSRESCLCCFTKFWYWKTDFLFHLSAFVVSETWISNFLFECSSCVLCGKPLSLVKLRDSSLQKQQPDCWAAFSSVVRLPLLI